MPTATSRAAATPERRWPVKFLAWLTVTLGIAGAVRRADDPIVGGAVGVFAAMLIWTLVAPMWWWLSEPRRAARIGRIAGGRIAMLWVGAVAAGLALAWLGADPPFGLGRTTLASWGLALGGALLGSFTLRWLRQQAR